MVHLNEQLLEKQKVTTNQKYKLINLYEQLNNERKIAVSLIEEDELTRENAKVIADQVRKIEFQMQENYNFEQDENRHRYWYTMPGCTCPTMDNEDAWGTKYHVVNNDCKYHGVDDDTVS